MIDKSPQDYPIEEELPGTCRQHCLEICRACIGESLAVYIANKPFDRVGCLECGESWDVSTIQLYASPADFIRYGELGLKRLLQSTPEYRACLNENCNGGQVHRTGEAEPIVTCNHCGSKSCYTNRVPWHEGMSCEQYDMSQETDEETQARLAAEAIETRKGAPGVKFCPKCQVPIQKDGGCDHMTCQFPRPLDSEAPAADTDFAGRREGCGFQFCWVCLADYREIVASGNHRHGWDCPYYRRH